MLLDGHVCLLFTGDEPKSHGDWHEACVEILEEDGGPQQLIGGRHWVHLGLLYLKPYRPTVQVLEELPSSVEGEVWLQQTNTFLTFLQCLQRFSLSSSWTVQLGTIVSSRAPVVEFQPHKCLVQLLEQTATSVWPPPPRQRARKTGSARRSAGPSAAAEEKMAEERSESGGQEDVDDDQLAAEALDDFFDESDDLEDELEMLLAMHLQEASGARAFASFSSA